MLIRLPHPEFAALIDTIKRDVIRREEIVLIDVTISYAVFRSEAETPDFACYDEQGTIYIPENLLHFNEQYAHLIALHEHVEIQHKRAGQPHAYAHRRALLTELLAAKQIFSEAQHFATYLQWRIGLYPEWKHLDQAAIVIQLLDLLTSNRSRKGALFQRIREYML
jgi:hypothetical protein